MIGALPARLVYDGGPPQVEWTLTDGSRFTEPFFEETLARLRRANPANARARCPRTALDALSDVAPGVPPAAFIFHVSRCGSTLLAQMLAALDRHIVASEPPIIDDLLRTSLHDPAVTDEDRIAWLRGAVRSLGQPNAAGAGQLFVKLDSWHIFSLPLIARAFPGVPRLFVYRHPLEVLVSLLRRPSLTLVRDTVSPAQLGLTREERDALTREEHAAAILGAFFKAALAHRDLLVPVAYTQLPEFVWTRLPGVQFSAEDRATLQAASRRNAKEPAQPFAPDTQQKRRAAEPALVQASARWAEPPYLQWLASL